MIQFRSWIHNRAAIDIAETLVASLWQAAIVAAILAAVLGLTRSSRLRYAAACCALLLAGATPLATFIYVHANSTAFNAPLPSLPLSTLSTPQASPAGEAVSVGLYLKNLLPWVTPAWLAGVVLLTLRNCVNWFGARRMRWKGSCAAPDVWQERLDALRRLIGISGSVELLESCMAQIPIVIGHIRPVILVPLGFFSGLPVEQAEMILMHELAHIRRWDYAVNLLQTLIEGLMFFNPAVLWISRVIRTEREHCCDDDIVAITNDPRGYAAALTALEEGRVAATHTVAATGGILVKRIRRLLYPRETANALSASVIVAGILIAISSLMLAAQPAPGPVLATAEIQPVHEVSVEQPATTLPSAQGQPLRPATIAPTQTRLEGSAALKKWVDEDVAYIINNEERAAFTGVQSDAERERFIQQFWLRRDPTPGTAANEFQDEHFRRIAYANEKFGSTNGPGWRTDRGRFYIMFGPPDELESHASGNAPRAFPFEIWLYRYLEGLGNNVIFEFIDPDRSGAYLLANPISGDVFPVSIVGAVRVPGVYNMKGSRSVLDVLAMAQGLVEGAVQIEILRRQDGQMRTINISVPELMQQGRRDLNIPILPGDVINVVR